MTALDQPVFVPLPAKRSSGGGAASRWPAILRPLMDRPGEWAIVGEYPSQLRAGQKANQLKTGRLAKPEGEWEFASRSAADGTGRLYARFVGPDGGAS